MNFSFPSEVILWGNSLEQYAQAIAAFLAIVIIGKLLSMFVKARMTAWTKKTQTKLDDSFAAFASSFLFLFAFLGAVVFGMSFLTLSERVEQGKYIILLALGIIISAVLLQKISIIILKKSMSRIMRKNAMSDTLTPFLEKLFTAVIWILGLLLFLSNIGFEVTSLIAGLGLGGLAFALAAKDTLGNFFASLAIFLDRPFVVGDMVDIGGQEGTVREVGMRSTRLQSFQGDTEFVLPNSYVAENIIENISKRRGVRFDFMLGLVYETSPQKIRKAVEIVKAILEQHDDVEEGYWVNFYEFGDFSLNIQVKMLLSSGPDNSYDYVLRAREEINFEILEQFLQEKIEMAFPTQTLDIRRQP